MLEKIVYGRTAMPKSVDELADMVLDEVTTSIGVAGVMHGVQTAFEATPGVKARQESDARPDRRSTESRAGAVEAAAPPAEAPPGGAPRRSHGRRVHRSGRSRRSSTRRSPIPRMPRPRH